MACPAERHACRRWIRHAWQVVHHTADHRCCPGVICSIACPAEIGQCKHHLWQVGHQRAGHAWCRAVLCEMSCPAEQDGEGVCSLSLFPLATSHRSDGLTCPLSLRSQDTCKEHTPTNTQTPTPTHPAPPTHPYPHPPTHPIIPLIAIASSSLVLCSVRALSASGRNSQRTGLTHDPYRTLPVTDEQE